MNPLQNQSSSIKEAQHGLNERRLAKNSISSPVSVPMADTIVFFFLYVIVVCCGKYILVDTCLHP
jgi:hypothetical protein